MKIIEQEAKTLLTTIKEPGYWFGVRYNMNLYRGCAHGCIYCDSRSECYQIHDFDGELVVKTNAPTLLRRELAAKREKGIIGLGAMSDPYNPYEAHAGLTRACLGIIREFRFPVHIVTKSDLILRDRDILLDLRRTGLSAVFTLTTVDDGLAAFLEPRAPRPSARLAAMEALSSQGVTVGVLMMPVVPFLEDNEENTAAVVEASKAAGAVFVIPGFGVTLRDRQREYFYRELDGRYPDLPQQYQKQYGSTYHCDAPRAAELNTFFQKLCRELGLDTRMRAYAALLAENFEQLHL